MTFLDLAEKVLREENKPLTHQEIWEIAQKKGYDKEINSKGKTPWATIGARIYVDIRDNPQTKFIKVHSGITKFFLKELWSDKDAATYTAEQKESAKKLSYKERDLHKYLTYFMYATKKIYTKTIYHESSTKKQFSEWLHPDMVGVSFPLGKWEDVIIDLSKEMKESGIKLFSFEIKKSLNFTNLRESYFQAVSNSSWAHSGFLVASEIDEDEEFLQELQRLVNAFGIGIIKLEVEDPDTSHILFQPRERETLDLETMNKLAILNPNFNEFLRRITTDFTSKEIREEKYDRIFEIEELLS